MTIAIDFEKNQSLSSDSDEFKQYNTGLILSVVTIAWFTLLFDIFVLCRLTCSHPSHSQSTNSSSRRIGLLHSKSTYIHLVGNTVIFLFIALRSPTNEHVWFCHVLNYFLTLFTAGIYGSSFCQSLFRYWRITQPNQSVLRQYSFHQHLTILKWFLLICLSLPICLRSIWIRSHRPYFGDLWSVAYIALVGIIPSVIGNFIIYTKVIVFLQDHSQSKLRLKRNHRNASIIRRISILLLTLLASSVTMVIIGPLSVLQPRFSQLSSRFVAVIVEMNMFICSLVFVVVSPQLRRMIKFRSRNSTTSNIRLSITSNPPSYRERQHLESISLETDYNLGL